MIDETPYVGRFAPSPTGDLHFGSLVAAIASYLQAKSRNGVWLIRIEDIDPPREVPGSSERILKELERFGMVSDQPVLFQSKHRNQFEKACKQLLDSNLAFKCSCSRKSLPASGIYPGTCRRNPANSAHPLSVRAKITVEPIEFADAIQGRIRECLHEECGDFVIWRADGLPAYQLAVVIDDAMQGITEVVRGTDLLDSTCRQIHLQNILGLPTPAYVHLPVATYEGEKLGKRLLSDPISTLNPAEALETALRFLGHKPPGRMKLEALWDWAIENWDISSVPVQRAIPLEDVNGIQH